MGASYGNLSTAHEEAIYDLKKEGKSGSVIHRALADGYKDLEPATVSASQANRIARRLLDERDELYSSDIKTKPAPEGLRILTRRLMIVAERETHRLERAEKAGRLDSNKLGRLATALTRMHGLLERNDEFDPAPPPSKPEDAPAPETPGSDFASGLLDDDDEGDAVPAPPPPPGGGPAPIADVALGAQGGSFAPLGSGDAVPHDPPPPAPAEGQGQGQSTGGGGGAVAVAVPG